MIRTEDYGTLPDGRKLIRTYSDENYFIRQEQTGFIYEEAIDVYPVRYTYTETDEKIPDPEPEPELPEFIPGEPENTVV